MAKILSAISRYTRHTNLESGLSQMDHLWTPWRYAYITRNDPLARSGVPAELADWPDSEDKHCVFCNMLAATDYAIAQGMQVDEAERATHIVHRGEKIPALPAIAALGKNTTWGSDIATRNVLFTPK